MRFHRKVQHGQKLGQTIGFPTLNVRVGDFGKHFDHGVYACAVFFKGKCYKAGLHFGPKLQKNAIVLEIHLLDFNQTIYDQFIHFLIIKKIRNPMRFNSLDKLKQQLQNDIQRIKELNFEC